jgi:hypothetical protein
VKSRSSGGGHRSGLRTFRTPPAVEAHVQLDDSSGEQIDGFLNSKSPLVLCEPHDVVVIHTSKVTSNRLRSPIGETASAHGFDTGFIPMSIVFPNSEISPGGAS